LSPASTLTAADWLARAGSVSPRSELFIDGAFVPAASGAVFDDIAGRDGSVITRVAEGGTEDVDRAVAAARRAFDDRRWSDRSPGARKAILLKLAELIRANLEELALLESLDVGKPIRDTLSVDVPSAAKTFQWYAETIDKVYGEIGPTGPDALSLVTREPIGVVAAIVPWNYPLIITAWKLGAALATGNSVVLKPASQSPLTALRLAELAS
jgi:acyl-CoA reductase-like NAD-dependent aldehyde dehydrogenase